MNEEKVIYSHAKMIFSKLLSRIKGKMTQSKFKPWISKFKSAVSLDKNLC